MSDIYIINERGPHFWETQKISKETSYAKLNESNLQIINSKEFSKLLTSLKDKRVLVYIHGLKNTEKELYEAYHLLKKNITPIALEESYCSKFKNLLKYYLGYETSNIDKKPYDAIIGYSWPSFDHESYYFQAKEHAFKIAPKLGKHLVKLSNSAKKVDIMAHSMGNLLLFEAISRNSNPDLKINNIYSIAAAVPDSSLSQDGHYSNVFDFCKNLFVFHSKHDFALSWPFFFAENRSTALGLLGPKQSTPVNLNRKLKVVDSSEFIKGHSDYLINIDFFNYLFKLHKEELEFENSMFNKNEKERLVS